MPLNRVTKWIAGIGLTIVAGLAVAVLVVYMTLPDLCENERLIASVSPDGKYEAISFRRNCGATTSYSAQVSVIRAGKELPNESGNVLVIRDKDWIPELGWDGPGKLVVIYPYYVDASSVDEAPHEISVEYIRVRE